MNIDELEKKYNKTFRQGDILLINADCMDVMKDIDKVDLAIVDPPYGISVTSMNMGGRKTITPDASKAWDNAAPDDIYFQTLDKKCDAHIIWGGNYFKLSPSQYFAVWDKGETVYGRDFAECEYAHVYSSLGKKMGTRIFKTSPNQLNRIHPTQKPVSLYTWLLDNYAEKGQTILDTHLGSASSAIAAHYYGVKFIGVELDADYFKAACTRFEQMTRQKSLL